MTAHAYMTAATKPIGDAELLTGKIVSLSRRWNIQLSYNDRRALTLVLEDLLRENYAVMVTKCVEAIFNDDNNRYTVKGAADIAGLLRKNIHEFELPF